MTPIKNGSSLFKQLAFITFFILKYITMTRPKRFASDKIYSKYGRSTVLNNFQVVHLQLICHFLQYVCSK